jgi:uncharacterized protein
VRALLAMLVLLSLSAGAVAEVAIPPLRAPVTDLTGTLTPEQIGTLESRLRAFETAKGSQIAVLLVPTTQPETVEQYSIRVAEAWQLGRKGVNDGVLLLVAKEDRAVRIEVGYGLEGALPDVFANRITDQVIVPRFRNGDFFGGLNEGVDRIIGVIEGEPVPEPTRQSRQPSGGAQGIGSFLPVLLMLVFVGSGILRRMFGSFGGAALTAGGAGVLVWVLTSVLAISVGAAVLALLFALFTGGGGGGWTNSRRGGWGGGGFGGGWGGGGLGGGGGGWSGGGGGFGGGGASGRW